MKYSRRDLGYCALGAGMLTTLGMLRVSGADAAASPTSRGKLPEDTQETQFGDPDLPPETMLWNDEVVDLATSPLEAIGVEKDARVVATGMLIAARQYVNWGRASHPEFIEEMFKIMRIEPRTNGVLKPFCAAGVAFSACQSYCGASPIEEVPKANRVRIYSTVLSDINKYYFRPHASCQRMVEGAKERGNWEDRSGISTANLREGWIVVYDWNDDGWADHVGIVQGFSAGKLHTIEFNTSSSNSGSQRDGGKIAERERDLNKVLGYIKTY